MPKETHTFVAYSFARGFKFGEVAGDMAANPTRTAPKDAITRLTDTGGRIYVYNFGALAFWNVALPERQREIERLRAKYPHGYAEIIVSDDFSVEVDPDAKPSVEFNRLILDKLTPERAEVVALTLAQSANMEFYEGMINVIWNKVAGVVRDLQKQGRVAPRPAKWHRFIGEAMAMRNEVVGVLHLLDRPELIWEDRTMDMLYEDLRAMFDLQERFQALTFKLGTIQDSLELLIDMARDTRLFLVELAIVILIVLEIGLSLVKIM